MLFKDVIGQKELIRNLIVKANNNEVSHASLFLGSLGHGGLPLALAFSQYINCENKQPEDSCGTCPSCLKAQKLVHPDIHFSYPFPSAKKAEKSSDLITDWREAIIDNPYIDLKHWMIHFDAENKQPNIPTSETQDIMRRLSLKAFEAHYKVMIIWLPEYLGKEGNKLLKILEEPPDNTIFILVAENHERILPTILSRTQIIKIKQIERDELKNALIREFNITAEQALRLASISSGNYNDSVTLLKDDLHETTGAFTEWIAICLPNYSGNKAISFFQWTEAFAKTGREHQKNFFKYGLHILREAFHFHVTGKESEVLTSSELKLVEELVGLVDMDTTQTLFEHLNKACFYIERNANAKIVLLNLSIRISRVLKQKKLTLS